MVSHTVFVHFHLAPSVWWITTLRPTTELGPLSGRLVSKNCNQKHGVTFCIALLAMMWLSSHMTTGRVVSRCLFNIVKDLAMHNFAFEWRRYKLTLWWKALCHWSITIGQVHIVKYAGRERWSGVVLRHIIHALHNRCFTVFYCNSETLNWSRESQSYGSCRSKYTSMWYTNTCVGNS